jgi:outer membrane protein OmpA-like peptidoglycan-associated protein
MKTSKIIFTVFLASVLVISGCSSLNRTVKGGAIGTAAGGTAGAVIGRASGNTAMGAVIGATVGGVAGAVIGRQMDKQAAEIENEVPGAKVERVGEGIVIEFKDEVLFGFDKYDIQPQARTSLDNLVQILNKYPDTNIEIHGHTDSQGSDKYNMQLSERRAKAVAGYLKQKNIDGKRLTTKAFGETMPLYSNDTEEGRAKNRRVEFAITANDKMIRDAKKQGQGQGQSEN